MRGIRLTKRFLMRFKWRMTIGLAVLLLIIAAISIVSGYRRVDEVKGNAYVSVKMGDLLSGYIDAERFESLPSYTITLRGEEGVQGVLLSDALDSVDALPTIYETVVCKDINGTELIFSGEEVMSARLYLVMSGQDKDKASPALGGGQFAIINHLPGGGVSVFSGLMSMTVRLQEE